LALFENVLFHGSIFLILMTIFLVTMMRGMNPRIWAYSDYPPEITNLVEPPTKRERRIAGSLVIPFFILMFGFPIGSTLILEASLGGTITIMEAFLNLFGLMLFGTLADLVIIDLLIVGTITPNWVIIPGTEHLRETAYKDFRSYHFKGHVKTLPILVILCFIIGSIIALV
jgi:hypothetical protein